MRADEFILIDDAWNEGWQAFDEGKSLNDCPYFSPNLITAWSQGFGSAMLARRYRDIMDYR